MNGILRLLCLLTALVIAGSAPSFAATSKAFSLLMTASPVYVTDPVTLTSSVQAPVTVTAAVTNQAPPSEASSNIGSFVLNLVVPGVTIDSVDPTGVITDSKGNVINASTGNAVIVPNSNNTMISVTGMGPLKGKQTFTLTFHVTSCGDAKWDATVYTGSQLTGQTFQRIGDSAGSANLFTVVKCGSIACGDEFSVADTTGATSNPFLFGNHGTYNEDGTCGSVTYFVSNMLLTTNQVHFRWPATGAGAQPNAAFLYNLVANSASVPQVGWKNPGGTLANTGDGTANPVYIDPVQCLSGQLPAPYGVLQQSASATDTQLKVNTSPQRGAVLPQPTTFPTPIVIGSERMNLLAIGGSTWTVERAQGNTAADTHSPGSSVMSTPLSLLLNPPATGTLANGQTVTSPYALNDVARMCIVAGSPFANGDGSYTSTFIDINDGWVTIR